MEGPDRSEQEPECRGTNMLEWQAVKMLVNEAVKQDCAECTFKKFFDAYRIGTGGKKSD